MKLIWHYNDISNLLNYLINKTRVLELYQANPLKTPPNFENEIPSFPRTSIPKNPPKIHFGTLRNTLGDEGMNFGVGNEVRKLYYI